TGGGVIAGFVAFGDSPGTAPGIELLHLAAFIGVGVAAWSLAPAQTRLAGSGEPAAPGAVDAEVGTGGDVGAGVKPAPGVAGARRRGGRSASRRARAASRVLPAARRSERRRPVHVAPARTGPGSASACPVARCRGRRAGAAGGARGRSSARTRRGC